MEYSDDYLDENPDTPEEEPRPRDPQVDIAKRELKEFFSTNPSRVYYERQLQVIFEKPFFHWITGRALRELAEEGIIASNLEELKGVGRIRFYRGKSHRYWRRQANEIIAIVQRFSDPAFTKALGEHGETMFDAALPTVGFLPRARNVNQYGGKTWTETNHNLDRVFERDGIAYGAEIKNTLPYIEREELDLKLRISHHLGLRPLFIVRWAPKSYVHLVSQQGGFTLLFGSQLYPFGYHSFAEEVRATLQLPVDCPASIADSHPQRFLKWHLSHVANQAGRKQA